MPTAHSHPPVAPGVATGLVDFPNSATLSAISEKFPYLDENCLIKKGLSVRFFPFVSLRPLFWSWMRSPAQVGHLIG